ncbi:recombinase family protein [Nocardioides sp. KR10-350]|uniref:recombinase family protein n=1 Tax=Nocardioides cheoyonin TaxID=3156615 RepID=UPI0032B4ECAA
MSTRTPRRPRCAILLARISDARGDGRSVADQVSDGLAYADRIGWRIGPAETHILREPDTSAWKRRRITVPGKSTPEWRVVRPRFRRALDMLATGQADGLIAYDLDRAMRDPRDLEDLIDLVEKILPGLPVESVTGSLRLSNDAEVTMARVMVAVANKASRDTSRRVARAARSRAESGGYHGGRRPYGWAKDGMTPCPDEARVIRDAAEAILAGRSLRSLTLDLNARGVPTATGRTSWTTQTVRDMLVRPRVAGLSTHNGNVVGRGRWQAVLDEDTWRQVTALLSDPARRTTPGNQPRWLGSGLYLCGICGAPMRCTKAGGTGRPHYRCTVPSSGHSVSADAVALDRHVIGELLVRLDDPAALAAIRARQSNGSGDGEDTGALARAIAKDETRLRELRRSLTDPDADDVDDIRDAMTRLRERIAERQARLGAASAQPDPVREFDPESDPDFDSATVWAGLDLERQRELLALLAVVTVQPARRGRLPKTLRLPDGTYRCDPDRVDVTWR